jgi:hypothetical protein
VEAVASAALPRWVGAVGPSRGGVRCSSGNGRSQAACGAVARLNDSPVLSLALCVGDDLADSRAQIRGKSRELFTVAQGAKSIHDPVAASIDASRLRQPYERLDCFGRKVPRRWLAVLGHEAV